MEEGWSEIVYRRMVWRSQEWIEENGRSTVQEMEKMCDFLKLYI